MLKLADNAINCIFANKLKGMVNGEQITFYECGNDKSPMHLRQACNAYCTRCKFRIALFREEPAVIDRLPEAKQMTMEDWLKGAV